MREFTIQKNDADQRLDRFLLKAVPLLPASLAQKYIRLKRIKVNGARAVDLDALEADVLLRQRGGQQGNGLEQKAVEPLVGVIFLDGELSHGAAPFAR